MKTAGGPAALSEKFRAHEQPGRSSPANRPLTIGPVKVNDLVAMAILGCYAPLTDPTVHADADNGARFRISQSAAICDLEVRTLTFVHLTKFRFLLRSSFSGQGHIKGIALSPLWV